MAIGLVPFLMILASGLASSGFDLARKVLSRHLAPVPMVCLLGAASVPLFGAAVALGHGVAIAPGYLPPAAASVVLNALANLAFIQAVRLSPLSVTIPLLSLTPAFTALLAIPVLGERPSGRAAIGIALVVAGALWLQLPSRASRAAAASAGAATPWRALLSQRGAWAMLSAALCWSLAIPLDKLAVSRAGAPFHGLFLTAGVALTAFALLLGQRRLGELAGVREGWASFFLALLASTLALGLQLFALRWVLAGLVETLRRGIGNLMAVALGRLVFAEPVTSAKLAAIAVMTLGVALIILR
jgi:drug/metabolite transporter (DMT)-like permease